MELAPPFRISGPWSKAPVEGENRPHVRDDHRARILELKGQGGNDCPSDWLSPGCFPIQGDGDLHTQRKLLKVFGFEEIIYADSLYMALQACRFFPCSMVSRKYDCPWNSLGSVL